MNKLFTAVLLASAVSACSVKTEMNTSTQSSGGNTNISISKAENTAANAATPAPKSNKGDNAECLKITESGKQLITDQTFEVDFEPFKGGCFVTFGDKNEMLDAKDLPRGSKFYIYKDGKKAYEFPDAFGGQSACWVEAVGFEDVSKDGKTDVIIAGKCLGAKDAFPSNAVFINEDGKFTTDEDKNVELDDLKTVKEIIGKYAKL